MPHAKTAAEGTLGGGALCGVDYRCATGATPAKIEGHRSMLSRPKPGHPPVLAYLATDRCPKDPRGWISAQQNR